MKSVRNIIAGTLVAAFAIPALGVTAYLDQQAAVPAETKMHIRVVADNCDPTDPPPRWACGSY